MEAKIGIPEISQNEIATASTNERKSQVLETAHPRRAAEAQSPFFAVGNQVDQGSALTPQGTHAADLQHVLGFAFPLHNFSWR